jgi:hypothetical protein
MVPFSGHKETDILYSDRKLFKLHLKNFDNGLQVKKKNICIYIPHRIGFLEKRWKDLQSSKSKK